MNIQGKLHAVLELQQISPTFRKREFVVEYADNPMYPQFVLFQLVQDRVELISGYNVGDMVDVSFNLRGRQWTSPEGQVKYFNSLEAWRINPAQAQQPQAQQPPQQQAAPPSNTGAASGPAVDVTQMEDDDDLPF
jgi:hypothetical protein